MVNGFFFSSRRRHTRWTGDWSSDVCSSDLEIALSGGEPPLRLYDTSGPYTDPAAMIDLKRGLDPLRLPWIKERGDVEELPGPSSVYRQERESDPLLGGVRFASV